MLPHTNLLAALCTAWLIAGVARAQPYGEPDRDQPGDTMIQDYLRTEADRIHAGFVADLQSLEAWAKERERYRQEYLFMLGLWPLPDKTPLKATVTGTLKGHGFEVDMVHYQSRPGLYVTGNLYRPAAARQGDRLPAVLYVCGHSPRGRDGNKTAFQSHGMWFARHGYICLVVDTLQLGEIAGIHHGTYREGRWWWHSRGYTPAGVECWNGVRGIDYLASRPDVDPNRIAVTGISGGGAATFWIAAADERVRAAVPVSGMADLPSYVSNRVINGHCDCMFLYNTFQWPWTRIAALIAPRPMMFVNSDQDGIFPMDANERVINRLERLYSLYGASDQVDAAVSIGGHAYRKDIRQAVFRFINSHLHLDPAPINDSEADLVTGPRNAPIHPIAPEKLRVFPTDDDMPQDELNSTIDQHFVPMAVGDPPAKGRFPAWKAKRLGELRRTSFRSLGDRVPAAQLVRQISANATLLETEPGIEIQLRTLANRQPNATRDRKLLVVTNPNPNAASPQWLDDVRQAGDDVYFCDSRGVGETRWTINNPPNYVERCHVLLGSTVDTGRVRDVAATARFLHAKTEEATPVYVAGDGGAGLLAAYAALVEPDIAGVILHHPPTSHMEADAPQFLSVLRVCDAPDVLGMLAPRPLTIHAAFKKAFQTVEQAYRAAEAEQQLTWQP